MFYETKVLDAYGNLKKIVSSQELHTALENISTARRKKSFPPEENIFSAEKK